MCLGEGYEPELGFVRSWLEPGMVFVDVGAHYGIYTLVAARCVGAGGAVLAFEPDPRNFLVLKENVRRNGARNVRLFRVALADSDGHRDLVLGQGYDAMSSFYGPRELADTGSVRMVPTRVLDGVLSEAGLKRLDLVKVDAEGAEPLVLGGALGSLARWRPTVIFEVNFEAANGVGLRRARPGSC